MHIKGINSNGDTIIFNNSSPVTVILSSDHDAHTWSHMDRVTFYQNLPYVFFFS